MRYRENAICLRTTDFSETSQVVQFLTRGQGVVRLLAKGTKRPKSKSGGMIDLLAEGELIYSHGGRETLGTLMEFSETVARGDLRADGRRLNMALFALEAAGEMLAEGDAHAEVFDLLHHTLIRLGQSDAPLEAVLAYFQWRLLRHVGVLGDLSGCVGCGQGVEPADGEASRTAEAVWIFSSSMGGLLCRACEATAVEQCPVPPDALRGLAVLRQVSAGRRQPLTVPCARAVNRVLAYHLQHQRGKRLRMARYVL